MARQPASPSQVFPRSREFGDSGEVVTEIQHIAIVDTHAPVSPIPHHRHLQQLQPHGSQKFLGGHRQGVRQLSRGLSYLTSQQLMQGATHKTYVDVTA